MSSNMVRGNQIARSPKLATSRTRTPSIIKVAKASMPPAIIQTLPGQYGCPPKPLDVRHHMLVLRYFSRPASQPKEKPHE